MRRNMAYLLHKYQRYQQTVKWLVLLLGIIALLISAGAFTLAHLQSQPQQIEQQQQAKIDFAAAYLQHFLTTQLKQTEALAQDRKSTRLNSSHVSISYAVFCLKKKK